MEEGQGRDSSSDEERDIIEYEDMEDVCVSIPPLTRYLKTCFLS
jgi:hypothetical protein